jgi:hypothetical protein
MKNTLVLTSLIAIVATGAANAATDVNFAGDYQLGNGSTANAGTALNGSTYTYTYTKSDSTTATVAQNVDPDLHFFTYTDKNGDPANLYDGGTDLTAASFDGATAADGTTVISHQTIAANETISRSNYEYVDGKGETVTLGDSARSFTETVALNPTYATVASVDVTDSSAAPVLAGTMYSYTDPDTGAVYHLNATGDEWVDANNLVVTPDAGTPQETARDAMVAAFATDSAAIATAKTTVDGYATAEATAFAAADGVYTTDAGTISTLTTNYGTYTTATDLLSQAQAAQTTRQGEFAADQALEAAAAGLYNTPIETVQAATLQDAKDYADGLASNYDVAGAAATAETNANAYADSLASNYDAAGAASAEQTRAEAAEGTLQSNIDAEADTRAAADTALQTNINTEVARATAAEGVLQSNIDAEADTRAAADTALQTNINTEVDRAKAAEGVLQSNIDAEAGTRAAADTALQTNINTEVDRAKAAEGVLQSNIDAEAGTRAAADTQLQSNIVAEADTRAAADTALQTKIDNEVARATAQEAAIRGEIAAGDALTLTKANAYTDSKVNALEKNVSGGVAAATALSAVNVANVGKGEVSVGGGYGYYNSQSAMAFGAAMGLSDKWSVNAGAGIAQGDKTQFSIRAGTNYKFKLF